MEKNHIQALITDYSEELMNKRPIRNESELLSVLEDLSWSFYELGREHTLEEFGPVTECTRHKRTALFCKRCVGDLGGKT